MMGMLVAWFYCWKKKEKRKRKRVVYIAAGRNQIEFCDGAMCIYACIIVYAYGRGYINLSNQTSKLWEFVMMIFVKAVVVVAVVRNFQFNLIHLSLYVLDMDVCLCRQHKDCFVACRYILWLVAEPLASNVIFFFHLNCWNPTI